MGQCPGCPIVPVVSKQLATMVLARKSQQVRERCLVRAFQWLTERHEGLTIYEGINGRPYTNEEKDAIALETGVVASLPCPLLGEDQNCLIGGLGPHYNRGEEARKAPYGWLPTHIALAWGREDLRAMVKVKAVADAKVTELTRNQAFLSTDEKGRVYVG